jgi:hypothetical protein
VFALTGGAFIPVNFIAVRMAAAYTHPRVFQVTGAQLPLSMGLTFVAALAAISLLFLALCRFELRGQGGADATACARAGGSVRARRPGDTGAATLWDGGSGSETVRRRLVSLRRARR